MSRAPMTAADRPDTHARTAPRRLERWRRRSRLIRTLRVVLPAVIALIFVGLIGSVAWSTFAGQPKASPRRPTSRSAWSTRASSAATTRAAPSC